MMIKKNQLFYYICKLRIYAAKRNTKDPFEKILLNNLLASCDNIEIPENSRNEFYRSKKLIKRLNTLPIINKNGQLWNLRNKLTYLCKEKLIKSQINDEHNELSVNNEQTIFLQEYWKTVPELIAYRLKKSGISKVLVLLQNVFFQDDKLKFNQMCENIKIAEGKVSFSERDFSDFNNTHTLIQTLSEKLKGFSRTTLIFSNIKKTVYLMIDDLVKPFLSIERLSNSNQEILVKIFEAIPVNHFAFHTVLRKLEENINSLEDADCTTILKILIDRELMLNITDSRVVGFLQQVSMYKKQFLSTENVKVLIEKHNQHIHKYFKWRFTKYNKANYLYNFLSLTDGKSPGNIKLDNLNRSELGDDLQTKSVVRLKHNNDSLLELIPGLRVEESQDSSLTQRVDKALQALPECSDKAVKLNDWNKRNALLQKNIGDLKQVNSNAALKKFYNQLLRHLSTMLHAARVIQTNKIQIYDAKTYYTGTGFQFLGELFNMPILSGLVKAFGQGIKFYGEMDIFCNSQYLAALTLTGYEADLFAQQLTLKLTLWLSDDLIAYDDESLTQIALYVKQKFEGIVSEHASESDADNLDETIIKYLELLTLRASETIADKIPQSFQRNLQSKSRHPAPYVNAEALICAKKYEKRFTPIMKVADAPDHTETEFIRAFRVLENKVDTLLNQKYDKKEDTLFSPSSVKKLRENQAADSRVEDGSEKNETNNNRKYSNTQTSSHTGVLRFSQSLRVESLKSTYASSNKIQPVVVDDMYKYSIETTGLAKRFSASIAKDQKHFEKTRELLNDGVNEKNTKPDEKGSDGQKSIYFTLSRLIKEFLDTEKTFVEGLEVLARIILNNKKEVEKILHKEKFSKAQQDDFFTQIDRIRDISFNPFEVINTLLNKQSSFPFAKEKLIDISEMIHGIFTSKGFKKRVSEMAVIIIIHQYFSQFADANFKCFFKKNGHQLFSFYSITILQRITRYEILMKQFMNVNPIDSLNEVYNQMYLQAKIYCGECNRKLGKFEGEVKLVSDKTKNRLVAGTKRFLHFETEASQNSHLDVTPKTLPQSPASH